MLKEHRALFVGLLIFLALSQGCKKDFPPIVQVRISSPPPLCAQLKGTSLNEGEACLAIVTADKSENDSGLSVKAGESYSFMILDGQEWRDASIVSRAPCGKAGEGMMFLFLPWKKMRGAEWFSLIAEIKGEGEGARYDICEEKRVKEEEGRPIFHVKRIKAEEAGRLLFYANDAPWMYWNNYGQIEVMVSREQHMQ